MIIDDRDGIDLEFMMLESGLRADAAYIAGLVRDGKQTEVTDYIESTKYLQRMHRWKQARR